MLSIVRFVSGSLSFFGYASRFGTVVPSLRIIDKHAIAFLAAALPLLLLLLERTCPRYWQRHPVWFPRCRASPLALWHRRGGKHSRSVHGRPLSSMVAD
jgi:hypothetical protein